jgi:hypothetical protein
MTTQLQYTGTQERYFETAVTGKSRVWGSGRIAEVDDGDATLLLATGNFRRHWATKVAEDGTPELQAPGVSAAGSSSGILTGPALLAGFGDSLTARCVTAASTIVAYSAEGPLSWLQALSGGKLWMPLACRIDPGAVITKLVDYCKGVSGETTADMLLRTAEVTALNPRPMVISWLGGTNDLTVAETRGDSALTVFNRWREIAERFLAAAPLVLCWTIPPRGSVASGASGSRPGWGTLTDAEILVQRGKQLQINDYIRAYCASRAGAVLVDPWRRLLDWSTVSSARADLTTSSDFLHCNDLGAYIMGDEARLALAPYLSGADFAAFAGSGDAYSAANNVFGSLVDGSLAAGTGGAVAAPVTAGGGGIPTGWTVNRSSGTGSSTGVAQKLVRPDGRGWDLELALTGGAGGPDAFRAYWSTGAFAAADIGGGNACFGVCDASVVATGAYAAPDVELRLNSARIHALRKSTVDVPGTYAVRLRTPLAVQPATPGALNYWTLDTVGTVASATVRRSSVALRRYNTSQVNAVNFA